LAQQGEKVMRTRDFKVPAGDSGLEIALDADYIRVRTAPVALVLENDQGDKIEISEGEDVAGWPVKRLRITHADAAEQAIKLTYGKGGRQGSAKVGGSIQIAGMQGAFTQGRASVTNANQAILPAKATRKFLMVQNNDLSQVLRVTLNGVAAGAAAGFRIEPGASLDLSGYLPTGAVNACMEAATGAANNVEFCEG
jgi:hypothetical protein